MELLPLSEEIKVDTILIRISHTDDDFDELTNRYNSGVRLSVSDLNSGIVMVDDLLTCLIDLRRIFKIDKGKQSMPDRLLSIFSGSASRVEDFRTFRSLIVAHPVDTDRQEKTVYLEDVREMSRTFHYMPAIENPDSCDFVLQLRHGQSGRSYWRGFSFKVAVMDVADLVFSALNDFNALMENELCKLVDSFVNSPITVDHGSMSLRLDDLRSITKIRYPRMFDCADELDEHCTLDDVKTIMAYSFTGRMGRMYDDYKSMIIKVLDRYEQDLQRMQFDVTNELDSVEYLFQAVHPDDSVFASMCKEDPGYALSKVWDYLSLQDEQYSGYWALEKIGVHGQSADVLRAMATTTNQGFAIEMLHNVLESISGAVDIFDFAVSNGEIAAQFRAFLFCVNKASKKKHGMQT